MKKLLSAIILVTIIAIGCIYNRDAELDKRNDGAFRLTHSQGLKSCQNPAFSPDGKHILFTRFLNGYNKGPSELVRINIATKVETVIIPAGEFDNVNIPGNSWIDGKITWASDRAGWADEIYIANEDGINIQQVTDHGQDEDYNFIEPVFNPVDTNKIIFEYAPEGPQHLKSHRISLVEIDKNSRITDLTSDSNCDDRLPNWSRDAKSIVFQRASVGQDNWQIYVADIELEPKPTLKNIRKIAPTSSHDTDSSWGFNDRYILSSSDYNNISVPNIYAFPVDQGNPIRITNSSTNEDGAPSCSPDVKWVVFESHRGQDENTPSDIWLKEISNVSSVILKGTEIYAFNGLPVSNGWGKDLVYKVTSIMYLLDPPITGGEGGI